MSNRYNYAALHKANPGQCEDGHWREKAEGEEFHWKVDVTIWDKR